MNLPPPSPFEIPAEPPPGRRHPVYEFIVAKSALWIGGLILLAIVGVVFFVAKGGRSQGAPENDAFREFFNDHRAAVCPVYVEAKDTLGLEVAEDTALELLEDTYSGTWEEALGTEALRMLDSCESSLDDQMTADEEASAANPASSAVAAPVETEPPAPEPTTSEPVEEPAVTASTTPTTATSLPRETFADLAAAADEVLGPLEMADGTRFAVLANYGENLVMSDGSVSLAVEGPNGWDVRQEIVPEASPGGLSAPADLDGDGQREIQVNYSFGANGYSSVLYRVDADGPGLAEVPFDEEELADPMGDYSITSVTEGVVTTEVESCDPSCADGSDYEISWNYDFEEQRLIPVTQPDLDTDPAPTHECGYDNPACQGIMFDEVWASRVTTREILDAECAAFKADPYAVYTAWKADLDAGGVVADYAFNNGMVQHCSAFQGDLYCYWADDLSDEGCQFSE